MGPQQTTLEQLELELEAEEEGVKKGQRSAGGEFDRLHFHDFTKFYKNNGKTLIKFTCVFIECCFNENNIQLNV